MGLRMSISVLALAAITAQSIADGDDVGLAVTGGRLTTIEVIGEPPAQSFGGPLRVFGIDFAVDPVTGDVEIDEPGLASNDPAMNNINLGFNIRGSARQWDVLSQSFGPSALQLAVGSDDLGIPFTNTPVTNTLVTGPAILRTSPFDFHYDWKLLGASAATGQGIYLVELEMTNPGGALLSSEPLWLVFNYDLSETEHDAAKDYVANVIIPAPGAASLLLAGSVVGLRRRRR
jgi:hypothetical protein